MGVWLPARLGGTKEHRELSTQRGTDMSLSIPTLPKPHPIHALCATVPAGSATVARSFPSSRPVHMQLLEGQILYSSYRKKGTYPRMNSSIHLRSWGRWRQHQSGSSPKYGACCWKHELTVWLCMGLVNPFRCQDVGFLWGWVVD